MPQRGLENNPATSGMIFSMGHPFFTAGYLAYKKLAPIVDTFVNKQLSKVAIKNIKKVKAGIDKFDGILMKNKMFKTGEMIVLRNSLDAIMQHGLRDKRIKIWLMNFRTDKISKMEYIGWDYPKKYKPTDPKYDPNNPDKFKHAETHYFLYYKTKIMGKTYYANVKLHKNYNKEVLYTLEKTKPEVIRTDEPPNIFKKRKS